MDQSSVQQNPRAGDSRVHNVDEPELVVRIEKSAKGPAQVLVEQVRHPVHSRPVGTHPLDANAHVDRGPRGHDASGRGPCGQHGPMKTLILGGRIGDGPDVQARLMVSDQGRVDVRKSQVRDRGGPTRAKHIDTETDDRTPSHQRAGRAVLPENAAPEGEIAVPRTGEIIRAEPLILEAAEPQLGISLPEEAVRGDRERSPVARQASVRHSPRPSR